MKKKKNRLSILVLTLAVILFMIVAYIVHPESEAESNAL